MAYRYNTLLEKMQNNPSPPPSGVKDIFGTEIAEGDIVQLVEQSAKFGEYGLKLSSKGVIYHKDGKFFIGWSYCGLAELLENPNPHPKWRKLVIIGNISTNPELAGDGCILEDDVPQDNRTKQTENIKANCVGKPL